MKNLRSNLALKRDDALIGFSERVHKWFKSYKANIGRRIFIKNNGKGGRGIAKL